MQVRAGRIARGSHVAHHLSGVHVLPLGHRIAAHVLVHGAHAAAVVHDDGLPAAAVPADVLHRAGRAGVDGCAHVAGQVDARMERARPWAPSELARHAGPRQRVVEPDADASRIFGRRVVAPVGDLCLGRQARGFLFALLGGVGLHALFLFADLQRHDVLGQAVHLFLHGCLGGFVLLASRFGRGHLVGRLGLLRLVFLPRRLRFGADVLAFLHQVLVLLDDAVHGVERRRELLERRCAQHHVQIRERATGLVEGNGAIAQLFLQLGNALLGSGDTFGSLLGSGRGGVVLGRGALVFGVGFVELRLERIDVAQDLVGFGLFLGGRLRQLVGLGLVFRARFCVRRRGR